MTNPKPDARSAQTSAPTSAESAPTAADPTIEEKIAASQEAEDNIAEVREANELSAPTGKVIYRTILQEGEKELSRPSVALFWSGVAAGLSMGFSMIMEGLMNAHLPDAPWRPLVGKFGYSAGFLVVILGRQQLFTENTLTPILPLLQHPTLRTLRNVARLWGIVLVANLLGAALLALVIANSTVFEANVIQEFAAIGERALSHGFGTTLLRGIFAGWLIALMVWLLPFAESGRFWVIVFITYLVGLGEFSHIIAGSIDTFTVAALGRASWLGVLGSFTLPTLLGNILGGITLVAVLNHVQIVAGREDRMF